MSLYVRSPPCDARRLPPATLSSMTSPDSSETTTSTRDRRKVVRSSPSSRRSFLLRRIYGPAREEGSKKPPGEAAATHHHHHHHLAPADATKCTCPACARPVLHARLARLRFTLAWAAGLRCAWGASSSMPRLAFLVCPATATAAHFVVEELTCRGAHRRCLALQGSGVLLMCYWTLVPLLATALRTVLRPTDLALGRLGLPWAFAGAFGALVLFPLWLACLNAEGGASALVSCAGAVALVVYHATLRKGPAAAAAAVCVALGIAAAEYVKGLVVRLKGEAWVSNASWYGYEKDLVVPRAANDAAFSATAPTIIRGGIMRRPFGTPQDHRGANLGALAEGTADDPTQQQEQRRALFAGYEPRRAPIFLDPRS